jgi:hypothetical protein
MTTALFAKILSWRGPGNFLFLALAVTTGLSGCATLSRYEQQALRPSGPVTAPPSPVALRQAEARGYAQGLQAGERIQAHHDHDLAQAAQDKAASAASAMAQEAVEETQDVQTLRKLCAGPKPAAKPAPAAAGVTVAVKAGATVAVKASPPDAFSPNGPARPLGTSPGPF